MAQVIPNQSATDSLEFFVNRTASENIMLRLFTNDFTPGEASVTADFTEALGSGYAAMELTSWDAPSEGDPNLITHPEQTFTFSADSSSHKADGWTTIGGNPAEPVRHRTSSIRPWRIA